MSARFGRVAPDTIEAGLDDDERAFLADLISQLTELIESDDESHAAGAGADSGSPEADELAAMVGIGTATSLPLDPVMARLFPNAYDDTVASGDFRRYTELRLRAHKARNAAVMAETLLRPAPLRLTEAEAQSWMLALNDLRLVLGTLLDISEEDDAEERVLESANGSYELYLWLTYLQGSLVDALAETSD